MKKILAVIFFSFLSLTVVNAERISLGVSGNIGMLEASGKETITGTSQRDNIGSQGTFTKQAGTSTTSSTKGSDDIFIGYVALFGELHMFDTGLRLGLSYVPYALESETTANTRVDQCGHSGNGTGGDAGSTRTACSATKQTVQVDVEDLTMLYAAYHHNLDLGFVDSVFIKAGVIDADVITKEKLSSGSKYGNATLSGQFVGLGVEKNMENGLFVRVEGNVTQYQNIKLQGTNEDTEDANTNTINITNLDGATATLSIGKSF